MKKMEWIEISKIKLSDKKMICTNDLLKFENKSPQTSLLVDENYNLLGNYIEYFQYLISRANLVPVVISSAIENFYLDNQFIEAA
jgi:hypothetical protein